MVTFLAGNITDDIWNGEGVITNQNGFRKELQKHWKSGSRVLYVCSDPADFAGNDAAFLYYRGSFERASFDFSCFDLVDYRYLADFSVSRLASYDVFILGSGRVPRQHSFFEELGLRSFFAANIFDGVVIGISAGALNLADQTYNWPEEPGDTFVSQSEKFYSGLGLAKTQVLPHFQARYDMYVDGRHLYNDITLKDSIGHEFLAIPDYSYVVCHDGIEQVFGAYAYYRNGRFYDFAATETQAA